MIKKIIVLVFVILFFSSCYTYVVYNETGGKKGQGIRENDYLVTVTIGDGDVWVKAQPYLKITMHNAETVINKESFDGQKILNLNILPVLMKDNDTLKLVPEKSSYLKESALFRNNYTCDDFYKKYRCNNNLYLKIEYDLDSLGVIIHKKFEYKMIKRRVMGNFRLG